MPTVDEVLGNYIEKRDRKAEMAKRHAAEMAPLNDAMAMIENWFMNQMNTIGVSQLKAEGVGTAFKATSTSCQMADPLAFKEFVFKPVADGIMHYLASSGYAISTNDQQAIAGIIRDMAMWDMIDFRAGKKGIAEYIENENAAVPGININTVATVSIRRS